MTNVDEIMVLVVDDDAVGRTVAEGYLAASGIGCVLTASVDEAIAALEDGELPDVILSDLMMPGRDGWELCEYVRGRPNIAHLPFLFLTAAGDRKSRIEALDRGADDLLAKPVDDVELSARVRSLARLSRSRRDAEERRRLDDVLDRVGEGILRLDLDGQLTAANAPACRLLGLPDDVEGLDLPRFLSTRFTWVHGTALTGAPVGSWQATIRREAIGRGEDLYLEVIEEPLRDGSGEPTGRVVVLHDATDVQRARRGSDVILSSIAHKFRTPLAGIRGAHELLTLHEPSPTQTRLLDVMANSVERLDDALLRVLQVTEAMADGSAAERMVFLPGSDATTVCDLVTGRARGPVERAHVTATCAVEVPVRVVATVLQELVDNAVASAGPDRVDVRLVADELGLTIEVEDSGPGFPPEDADRIFERFFQVDRTGQHDGLGLGLPLVRTLAEGVQGSVHAESRPGGPTIFRVVLPPRGGSWRVAREDAA